jgi:hypothetical protein
MRISIRGGLMLTMMLAGVPALAADMPMPKVMSDAPTTAGAWRMEMEGMDKAAAAQIGGGMTVCQTAAQAMSRDQSKDTPRCTSKLVEDSATKAVMEMSCPDGRSRMTITRAAARSYTMSMQRLDQPGAKAMNMRMSYVGPCSEKDSVISIGKDTPACKQARTQLAELDKAKASCAKSGAQRAQCEQMIAQSRATIEGMCK